MTVGPETYESIPTNLGHGNWFVTPEVLEHYGEELLDQINQPGATPIIPPGMPDMHIQRPSVGRVVHYHSYGTPNGEYQPVARAAIITEVSTNPNDIRVSLCVLNPEGMFFNQNVSYSVSTPGCWSWPPRA